MLNSFTWSHSLDNASASLEGNTPSPQDGNNIAADYSQSDYNLPIADVLSLVYDLPFGRGKQFLAQGGRPDEYARGRMAAQWYQHHAGWYTVQPHLHTEFRQLAFSPDCCHYRGSNEYRPNRVNGVPLTERVKLSSGYIQYVNYSALALPATRDPAEHS